jgi:hypothetical protein
MTSARTLADVPASKAKGNRQKATGKRVLTTPPPHESTFAFCLLPFLPSRLVIGSDVPTI